MGAAIFGGLAPQVLDARGAPPQVADWDAGLVRHLLPTVSDSRMLLKVSFVRPLSVAPTLRMGPRTVLGRMTDTVGEHWQFYVTDLDPGRRYSLSLVDAAGSSLCEPWSLSTFPPLDTRPERFRLLCFTPRSTLALSGASSTFVPTMPKCSSTQPRECFGIW